MSKNTILRTINRRLYLTFLVTNTFLKSVYCHFHKHGWVSREKKRSAVRLDVSPHTSIYLVGGSPSPFNNLKYPIFITRINLEIGLKSGLLDCSCQRTWVHPALRRSSSGTADKQRWCSAASEFANHRQSTYYSGRRLCPRRMRRQRPSRQ